MRSFVGIVFASCVILRSMKLGSLGAASRETRWPNLGSGVHRTLFCGHQGGTMDSRDEAKIGGLQFIFSLATFYCADVHSCSVKLGELVLVTVHSRIA